MLDLLKPLRRFSHAMVLLLATAVLSPALAADLPDPRATGPLELVIMVHTQPDQRIALRQAMETTGLRQYEQWKREGMLSDYLVLFNRYVDNENWDMMMMLTFADHAAAQRWKDIERSQPAGLPPAALPLARKIETAPSDLLRMGAASKPAKAGESVYVVLPYNYFVSTNEYIKYVDDYLIPQTAGWVDAGLLSTYGVHLNRYPSARFWSSLLVLQYKDDEALGHRDALMAKVRAGLADSNPTWKAVSQSKQNIREGRMYVIADQLQPR